jgi:hypothetical protein
MRIRNLGSFVVLLAAVSFLLFSIGATSQAGLPEGLVGYWMFDNGSGNKAMDSSGNNNHGVLKAGDFKWTKGKIKGGLEFTKTGSFVEVPHNDSFDSPESLTVQAWVYPTQNTGGCMYIVDNFHVYGLMVRFDRDPPGAGEGWIVNGGFSSARAENAAEAEKWTHLAVTFSKKDGLKFYLNGKEDIGPTFGVFPAKNQAIAPSDGPLVFGNYWKEPATYTFLGILDEVAVFNVVRSASEIVDSMEGVAPTFVEPAGKLATVWSRMKSNLSQP